MGNETQFVVGEKVGARDSVQGLESGVVYQVTEVIERRTLAGTFVTYVVEPLGGAFTVRVQNGHLLLFRIEDEAKLSENQAKFVRAAKRAGLDVFQYSGRGMFGRKCPAVSLDRGQTFRPRAATKTDSLGLGTVVYAQD